MVMAARAFLPVQAAFGNKEKHFLIVTTSKK